MVAFIFSMISLFNWKYYNKHYLSYFMCANIHIYSIIQVSQFGKRSILERKIGFVTKTLYKAIVVNIFTFYILKYLSVSWDLINGYTSGFTNFSQVPDDPDTLLFQN